MAEKEKKIQNCNFICYVNSISKMVHGKRLMAVGNEKRFYEFSFITATIRFLARSVYIPEFGRIKLHIKVGKK